MATNKEVKQAFQDGKPAASANLVSTGEKLLSYGWWEVARWIDGRIVLRKGASYSPTTATKHRPGIVGERATVETPAQQGEMNV